MGGSWSRHLTEWAHSVCGDEEPVEVQCNSNQLRPANSTEELAMEVVTSGQYRDLLQQMQGSHRCSLRRVSH